MKSCLSALIVLSVALVFADIDARAQGTGAVLQGKAAIRPMESRPGGSHNYLSRYTDGGKGRLAGAVDSLGAEEAVLVLDIDDTLGSNLTVPETIRLVHFGAALIDLAGHDLQIDGGLTAQKSWIFTGAGEVAFAPGSMERILPQWWGDKSSQNVQTALTAAVLCGAELYMPAGEYTFTETVGHDFAHTGFDIHSFTIRGAGPGHTVIDNQTAGEPALRFSTVDPPADFAWFITISGLEITTSGSGGNGIEAEDVWNGHIYDCYIHDLHGDGICLRAGDQLDLWVCRTWNFERSVLIGNDGYGILLEGKNDKPVSFNVVMDELDVEVNKAGGIYVAAERTQIINSIIAYNGEDSTCHGGVHVEGVVGYWVHNNIVAGNGFEANCPYDIFVDRAVETSIEQNSFVRAEFQGMVLPDNFIILGNPDGLLNTGVINVEVKLNKFRSIRPSNPITAIAGSSSVNNVELDDNIFHILTSDERYVFDPVTKVTYSRYGDRTLTNQSLYFADPATGEADTTLERSGPGMLKVTGGVTQAIQNAQSIGGAITFDCAQGLNVVHSLTENTTLWPPASPKAGAILNLIVFQAYGSHTIEFDPIFKTAEPFTVSSMHFSTIRFIYNGQYWIQLGGAAIDAPL